MQIEPQPFIIFTTAFNQYALKAFEHHAMDYLLKPIERDGFNHAVIKVFTQIKGKDADGFNMKFKALLGDYAQILAPEKKSCLIKQHGINNVLRADEIYGCES